MPEYDPDRQRHLFALCWEIVWPALGATLGAIMGGVIGGLAGGVLPAVLFALVGIALGLEAGHLFGTLLALFFLPWVELFSSANSWPAVAGCVAAACISAGAIWCQMDAEWIVLVASLGFVFASWTVRRVQNLVSPIATDTAMSPEEPEK